MIHDVKKGAHNHEMHTAHNLDGLHPSGPSRPLGDGHTSPAKGQNGDRRGAAQVRQWRRPAGRGVGGQSPATARVASSTETIWIGSVTQNHPNRSCTPYPHLSNIIFFFARSDLEAGGKSPP